MTWTHIPGLEENLYPIINALLSSWPLSATKFIHGPKIGGTAKQVRRPASNVDKG
jgi:hypothetical protein